MLYKDWLDEWLELYVKVSTKEQTYRKYSREIERYIVPELGMFETHNLTATDLQRFSVSLSENGLAPNTVRCIISVVKLSLKKAVRLGVADKHYADAIVMPRAREKKIVCFNRSEQRAIEMHILEKDDPALFGILLCLYSGLRIGELLALTWDDVDFQTRTISVTKSCHDSWEKRRYVKVIDSTKTRCSERTIPLPQKIIGYMRKLRKRSKTRFVVAGKGEYGVQVRSYQRTFERMLKQLKIEHKSFHVLRHTFATRALEVGMDVKTLSEVLGHVNPNVTLQRYAHSLLEHKAEMMNKIGNLLPCVK